MDTLRKYKSIFNNNTLGYRIDQRYVQDIDTEEDWEYAELKYKILNEIK